ncbi:MAG TPA: hypothetical protein PLG15_00530 [Candidatus Gastranaerophilaceae bacterium]|nr:hypothetical protein [Candidatus Gastranaerophilaceae bacterium]
MPSDNSSNLTGQKGKRKLNFKKTLFLERISKQKEKRHIKKLLIKKLSEQNIENLFKSNDIDYTKIFQKLILACENIKGQIKEINIRIIEAPLNNIFTEILFKNHNSKIILMNKNGEILSEGQIKTERLKKGSKKLIKTLHDFRNNTESKTISLLCNGLEEILHERIIFRNNVGEIIESFYLQKSSVAGVYNLNYKDKQNKLINYCKALKDKNGNVIIKKNIRGNNNVKTQYYYIKTPSGSRKQLYRIIDENGETLLNKTNIFEVINDNKSFTNINGRKYTTEIVDNSVIINNINTGEVLSYNIDDIIENKRAETIAFFKKINAEDIITMIKNKTKFFYVADDYLSGYSPTANVISCRDNLFSFGHELGHTKVTSEILNDEKLLKIFSEEQLLFKNASTLLQQNHLNYFTETSDRTPKSNLHELIAETNAILNTYQSNSCFGIRAHYLQQYFPKTIARICDLIGNNK